MKPNSLLSTHHSQPDPEQEIQEPDGLWLAVLIWLHLAWDWLTHRR